MIPFYPAVPSTLKKKKGPMSVWPFFYPFCEKNAQCTFFLLSQGLLISKTNTKLAATCVKCDTQLYLF